MVSDLILKELSRTTLLIHQRLKTHEEAKRFAAFVLGNACQIMLGPLYQSRKPFHDAAECSDLINKMIAAGHAAMLDVVTKNIEARN